jgi:hypothetical protein
VFSFNEPYREEANIYSVEFPHRKVLAFSFEAIQLNRLNWRDFLTQPNPVAAALMSKMRIATGASEGWGSTGRISENRRGYKKGAPRGRTPIN